MSISTAYRDVLPSNALDRHQTEHCLLIAAHDDAA